MLEQNKPIKNSNMGILRGSDISKKNYRLSIEEIRRRELIKKIKDGEFEQPSD